MPRQTYVMRNGKLVPKHLAPPLLGRGMNHGAMPDIEPFVTTDGVEITGRAALREYQRRTGLEQVGDDLICGKNDDGSLKGRIVQEMPDVRPLVEEAMRIHSDRPNMSEGEKAEVRQKFRDYYN